MALVYNLDAFSSKSHRHGTSGRRKTNYDKYGYEVATLGSSSTTNGKESVMHVLRVQPGVVVNFIESPSSSSRNRHRSWTAPRVVEYKSSSHSHASSDPKDPLWTTSRSFHHTSPRLVDDGKPLNSLGKFEQSTPLRDSRSSPTTHHFIPDEQFPEYFQEPYYQEPYYAEPYHMGPHVSEKHHMEPHYPESHYPVECHDSPRHIPSPIDIPIHSHTSDHPDYSPSISDMARSNHGDSSQLYDFDTYHSPGSLDDPIHISPSPRSRRHSFDSPYFEKPPSPMNSNTRTVRFKDNPVSPSPPERRKGWWNRRGDQLWDNDGSYVPAPEHHQYPSDLRNYPDAGTGWMNEDGVQIDMKRRLVRKKPLRSALKKSTL